jgi:hypothetical protein
MDSLSFFGKTKFFYVYTDEQGKQKSAKLLLDENMTNKEIGAIEYSGKLKTSQRKLPIDGIDRRYGYASQKLNEVKELERVTLQSKNKKPTDIVNEKYTTGVFRSSAKATLDNINDPVNDKSMNAVDFIRNRIQQVEIQGNGFVNRKNMSLISGQKWSVGIFLNEIPADISSLRGVRVNDVALVKFFDAGFVGVGSGSPGGAIAVYTKERFDGETKPEKMDFVIYNGYAITKEFYNPEYSGKESRQTVDQRATLFWNPDVYFDSNTKSMQFRFFNNDLARPMKVIVEGFDANGKLIHIEKKIGEK